MKTKNILKIGVFSIVLLSLLISPTLKANVLEAHAADLENEFPELWTEIQKSLDETSSVDICEKAFPDTGWGFLGLGNVKWWQHKACVFQIGTIEGLGKMFNATINWGIAMTLWAIEPATFGGFVTNSGVVKVGKIIRDFINLFLILGLVFIAIATILGMKKYSWQQTLWKLVVVALLVNFSLVISGMILDVSYFFTYNFLNLAKANNDISVAIKSGFNASSTMDSLAHYCLFSDECAGVTVSGGGGSAGAFANGPITSASATVAVINGWGLSWGNFFITVIGMILIGLFAVIALLAVFVTMMLRACLIIMLLCLSPIAFAAWIFPDTEKYWKMWWEQFIKWCTFPVIFSLMLFMGITVMSGLFSTIGSGEAAKLGMIAFGIRMVLFSMFLVGGLIFSIQGGGATSQLVMKQAGKVRSAVGAAVVTGVQGSRAYRAVGQRLTQVPVLNKIGYNMLDQSDRARFTNIRKIEKDMENAPSGQILATANGLAPSPINRDAYAHYMAAVRIATRKGWLNNDSRGLGYIRTHLNDPNLNIQEVRDAFPQYFRIVNDQLEEIDTEAQDYMNNLVTNIASMSAKNLSQQQNRERIFQAADHSGVDRNLLIQQLTQRLTSSQQVALYGNFDNGIWNNDNGQPWGGGGGIIDQAVQNTPAQAALQNKLASSGKLREILNMPPATTQATPPPPRPGSTWNPTYNCWLYPATGAYLTPQGLPPSPRHYWSTLTGTWVQF